MDKKAEALERTIEVLTDKHFPLVRTRRRSNEPPWITNRIRRLFRRKCRIYKKDGRSQKWWAIDRVMQGLIAESRQEFVDKALEDGNSGKSFYAAAKSLATPGSAQSWTVADLFPGSSPGEVCDNVLEYFSGIGGRPLRRVPALPRVQAGLPTYTESGVTEMLRKGKKQTPESRVIPSPTWSEVVRRALLPHLPTSTMRSMPPPHGRKHGRLNTSLSYQRTRTLGTCPNAATLAARPCSPR